MAVLPAFGAHKLLAFPWLLTMRFFPLLLLSCLTCVGQPGPIALRSIDRWPTGPVDIPSSIGLTISNRWMATHFATNATGISDWVDETNGFHMTLAGDIGAGAASATTNSPQGIYLDSAHCFWATNTLRNANLVTFFIFYTPTQNGLGANQNVLFYDWANSPVNVGYRFTGSSLPLNVVPAQSSVVTFGKIPDHATNNMICYGANTVYTNGVLMSSSLTLLNWSHTNTVGALNAQTVNVMGGAALSFLGMLKEFIIYQESTINASQISNLNYYASHYPYQ